MNTIQGFGIVIKMTMLTALIIGNGIIPSVLVLPFRMRIFGNIPVAINAPYILPVD